MIAKKLNYCQACWSLYLVYFDFTLCHYPRQSMEKLDVLFWRPNYKAKTEDNNNITFLQLKFFAIRILKQVELIEVKQKILFEIHHSNCNRDLEELAVKAILELQQSTNKLLYFLEWSNIDGLVRFWSKIYVLQNLEFQRQIILLCHDSKIAGHSGYWKMLELVLQNYQQSQMLRYIS